MRVWTERVGDADNDKEVAGSGLRGGGSGGCGIGEVWECIASGWRSVVHRRHVTEERWIRKMGIMGVGTTENKRIKKKRKTASQE